jgi:hypothetical protein
MSSSGARELFTRFDAGHRCRPNALFAELVQLSRTSIADEMRIEHTRRVLGE